MNDKRKREILWITMLTFLAAFPYIVYQDSFFLHTMIYLLFFIVMGAGLNLVMTTGQLSIGHAAFMGIGAYTCVILVMRYKWPFWLGWAGAAVCSGLCSWILGRITLGIKGVFFGILTFAFGEIVRMLFVNLKFFGGTDGITGIPAPPSINVFGLFQISFESKTQFYYLVMVFSLICLIIYFRIIKSQIGKVFKAIEQGDLLAECCGIDIMKYKLMAFVIGSVMAGMVGALYAHYLTYISPQSFTFVESIDMIIINVVGGAGTVAGPIYGALYLVCLPEIFRFIKGYELIIYAISLILVLFFLPKGIAGTIDLIKSRKIQSLRGHELG
jgi:branched-chain amino acid transport system permease protein